MGVWEIVQLRFLFNFMDSQLIALIQFNFQITLNIPINEKVRSSQSNISLILLMDLKQTDF